jgi:hypothetical protein
MLGLIRTRDTARLVWGPDAGDEREEWIAAPSPAACTVVVVRPLSALDMVRAQAGLAPPTSGDAESLVEWMAAHIRAALVSAEEGDESTTDADLVLHGLDLVQLLGLGSAVIGASGPSADPT